MKSPVFTGAATALITPFDESGIDYNALARLIDWQIESGINALVVCGTTGESSTLTDAEHKRAIEFTVKQVNGRGPVIAGTGSNDAAYALELTDFSCKAGVDGVLVVTPYYNKATQNGLFRLFTAIADKSSSPVILYNVPSRTGVNMTPETVAKLSLHPNINGIKEAGGSISAVAETAQLCGDNINIYSGNDDQTVPIMSLGGKGCISVLSNLLPKETAEMCEKMLKGDTAGARRMQLDYLPLIKALFCEVNPIPVKTALNLMGWKVGPTRMPLCEMEPENEERLKKALADYGIKLA